jgi:hypothetical protein
MNPLPIICRTLRREYRLHFRSEKSRELFRFIETAPSIAGAALEPFDIEVGESFGFFSLRLPNGVFTEGTSAHCIGVLHGLMLWDTLQTHEGRPMIHGATVIVDGRRLLIVGEKGTGKSTLVLHLLTKGHDVEGDEHLLIADSHVVVRPRTLRIKPDSLSVVSGLPAALRSSPWLPAWNGARFYSVDPAVFGRPWRIAPGPLDAILFARSNHGGRSHIAPISQQEAFAGLLRQAYLLKTGVSGMAARLRRLVGETPVGLLSLGDLDTAEWHIKLFGKT